MRKTAVIALMTDYGLQDPYVGVVKAVITNINPEAKIIDITHDVPAQNLTVAGIYLKYAYTFFPKNTIFVVIVDPGVGTKRKIISAVTKDYIFLAPDNGVLGFLTKQNARFYEITNKKYFLKNISTTFHGRDIFAPVAGFLSRGVKIEKIGKPIKKINNVYLPEPVFSRNKIYGVILFADRFGNLISNIPAEKVHRIKRIELNGYKIYKYLPSYGYAKPGEVVAVKGSFDMIEIAVVNGSAQEKLKAGSGSKVEVFL